MNSPLHAARPVITAVIVAHDGERWIPQLTRALEAGSRIPDRLVAVDTGSTDASRQLLGDALGADQVLDAPRTSGFGAAVDVALATLPPTDHTDVTEWLWLLHDDCAPAPDALEQLHRIAADDPTVSVIGCRIRAWPRARRLLEVGVSITGTGHRETGLELGEYDQGQHDGIRQVLAVSSAGMLVRRDVFESLGGFDARLPLFRDDVDLGWRVARSGGRVVISPDAVLFHAEAATRGVRQIDNTSSSPHRADRKAALFTLLANCSLLALPVQYVRLFLGSLIRALGYLVGKLPSAAWDEVAAMASVLVRPDRILAARRARRRTATVSSRAVRPLLPAWYTPYLNGIESVLSAFADRVRDTATTMAASARRLRSGRSAGDELESGPVPEEAVNLPSGPGPVVWAMMHPLSCLSIVLVLIALVATRGLWGGGFLQGGALLPAPDGAGQWWSLYGHAWHPVALGSTEAPSTYVAVLASLGTLLFGQASLLVDILMLLAVPLSALGAFVAARRLVARTGVRVWMAASYALLPVVTGAVTSGHIGTVVATILLPWLVRCVIPLWTGTAIWRGAFASALVLALMTAFCPISWLLAVIVGAGAAATHLARGRGRAAAATALALLLPVVLLLPWSLRFLTDPSLLLTEAGRLDQQLDALGGDSWQLVFGRLQADGAAPWWLTIGYLLAAVFAWFRSDIRDRVAVAWGILGVALAAAALTSMQTVTSSDGSVESYVWVGFAVVVAQGAAIVAAGLAADGLRTYVETAAFGWRQPLAAAIAIVAVLTPVAAAVWWVGVAPKGQLERATDTTLPAYLFDTLQSDSQQRILVLTGDESEVDYVVLADDGVRLGDESVDPQLGSTELDAVVSDALSSSPASAVPDLVDFGIGYVMLPSPADPGLVTSLDSLPGLTRTSTNVKQVVGWQVDVPAGFARVLDTPDDLASAKVLASSNGAVSSDVDAGSDARQVRIAVPPDANFTASLDGEELTEADSESPFGTTFEAGAGDGELSVAPPGHRGWWLLLQAVLWIAAVVLATPSMARRQGIAEDVVADPEEDRR